ncbi:MAG: hypothetical protein OXB91_03365, partial [Bryobacterales bacterium]|nr:hypothetical protein [Bryobacterales bacterium]
PPPAGALGAGIEGPAPEFSRVSRHSTILISRIHLFMFDADSKLMNVTSTGEDVRQTLTGRA